MEGNEYIRFRPVAAWETPASIDKLCKSFREAKAEVDPLLLDIMFVLDFLCIHPFNDGNGRMSRLITLLLLYQSGFIVGKYISIEKIIEESKETYYEVLQDSSINWHENQNDYKPFVNYMLGVIINAYREFETRVKLVTDSDLSKPDRIRGNNEKSYRYDHKIGINGNESGYKRYNNTENSGRFIEEWGNTKNRRGTLYKVHVERGNEMITGELKIKLTVYGIFLLPVVW